MFPKSGPYDFYFVNLTLLGAILAIFQFSMDIPKKNDTLDVEEIISY